MSDTNPGASPIVAVRFPAADLATIEAAQEIMGDRTLSAFVRSATLAVAKAVLEASASVGGRGPADGWNSCEIRDATIERKP